MYGEEARRVDVRQVEAPGQETGDRLLCGLRRLGVSVGAEQRDTHRARVESSRVGSDYVAVGPAEPALVHSAESVDEKVVADVVPAVPLDVEQLDALDDRCCLGPRVVVTSGGVMHDRKPNLGGVCRRSAANRLIRSPREPWNHRGRVGSGRKPVRHPRLGAPDEMRANSRYTADGPRFDRDRWSNPPGIALPPTNRPHLGRPEVRSILVLRRPRTPLAPSPRRRASAKDDAPGTTPLHAGKGERRRCRARRKGMRRALVELDRRHLPVRCCERVGG